MREWIEISAEQVEPLRPYVLPRMREWIEIDLLKENEKANKFSLV